MLKTIATLVVAATTSVAAASYTHTQSVPVYNGFAQVTIYDFNSDSLIDAVTVNGTPVQWGTLTDSTHEIVSDITVEAWTAFMLGLRDGTYTVPNVTVASATLQQRYDDLPIYQDWQTTPKLHRGVYMNPVSYDVTSEPYKQANDYLYNTWWNEYAPPVLPVYRSGLWVDDCTLDIIDRLYKYDDGTPIPSHLVPGTNPPKYSIPLDKPIQRDGDVGLKILPAGGGIMDFTFEDECPIFDEENLENFWEGLGILAFPIAPGYVPQETYKPVNAPLTEEELDILEDCGYGGPDPRPLLPRLLTPDEFTAPFDPIMLPFDGPGSPRWIERHLPCFEIWHGPNGERIYRYNC